MRYCKNGVHEMTSENSYTRPDNGSTECRACRKARLQEHRSRLRAAYRQIKETTS